MSVKSKRIITAAQARAIDKIARERFAVPTLLLMENAGMAIAGEASGLLRNKPAKIAIFCGKGNNGGDGFCAARHLLARGIKPDIFLCGKVSAVKGEARVNLDILVNLKQKITAVNERNLSSLKKRISGYGLIIDALLGVGLKGEVKGAYRDLINLINSSGVYILSVDIPSGLDATSGKVLGVCVKADRTVTFVAQKRGMVYGSGARYCGKVVVANLGVPF